MTFTEGRNWTRVTPSFRASESKAVVVEWLVQCCRQASGKPPAPLFAHLCTVSWAQILVAVQANLETSNALPVWPHLPWPEGKMPFRKAPQQQLIKPFRKSNYPLSFFRWWHLVSCRQWSDSCVTYSQAMYFESKHAQRTVLQSWACWKKTYMLRKPWATRFVHVQIGGSARVSRLSVSR